MFSTPSSSSDSVAASPAMAEKSGITDTAPSEADWMKRAFRSGEQTTLEALPRQTAQHSTAQTVFQGAADAANSTTTGPAAPS